MNLEKVIAQLILKHACVIVPDFGGFISQRVPAVLDFKSGKILPPSKSILFNKQLFASDGLLVGAYSQENQVSYSLATTEIAQTVATWKIKLNAGERVGLEHIGYLYTDNTGQICFEQDKFVNLLLSSYGLSAISVQKTENTYVEETQTIDFIDFNSVKTETVASEHEPKIIEINVPRKLHWTRYVAAAALLPIVFYSVWIPTKTDFLQSGILSIHDFNPFKKVTNVEFKPTKITENTKRTIVLHDVDSLVKNSHAENSYSYEVDGNTYQSVLIEKEEVKPTETVNAVRATANFYLIGNCFSIQTNAENFVAEMSAQGLSAEVVDNVNGLYRVAIGKANSAEEIEQVKQEVLAKGISNFWILKK